MVEQRNNLWTPDSERWPHRGWQGYDLTTSGNLFNPSVTFENVHIYNSGKSEREHVGIEVYTTVNRFGIGKPPTMNTKYVSELQEKYSNAKVVRIHPPFTFDIPELSNRWLIGEWENKHDQIIYNLAWIPFFGAATNMRFAKLAGDLKRNGQNVSVNMHTNLIEGFKRAGRLSAVKEAIEDADILAENERKYKTFIPRDLIADPIVIKREIIDRYDEVNGLLLGYDHGDDQGYDMLGLLDSEDIRDTVRVIHLANTHKELEDEEKKNGKRSGAHMYIEVGDKRIGAFLRKLAQTPTKYPVRIAFDYSPLSFGRLSQYKQFRLLVETIDWMNEIREGRDADPRILEFSRRPERGLIYAAA